MSLQTSLRNLIDLCRLCMEKDRCLVPIFDITDTTDELCRKISSCLSIEVSRADELSKKICKECLSKVDSFYEFWCQTARTQRQFSEWLSDNKRIREELKKSSFIVLPQVQMRPPFQLVGAKLTPVEGTSNCGEKVDGKSNGSCEDIEALDVKAAKDGQVEEVGSGEVTEEVKKRLLPAYTPLVASQPGPSEPNPIEEEKQMKTRKVPGRKSVGPDVEPESWDPEKGVFTCRLCPYQSRLKGNFKKHKMRHEKMYKVHCEECEKGFYSKAALREHHSGGPCDRRYKCDKCNRKYRHPEKLNEHIKSHLPDYLPKGFQCEMCGKTFLTRRGLGKHLEAVHHGVRYSCQICKKNVMSSQSLKNHLKIHSGEKSYVCAVCGKAFVGANSLTVHERTHSGERPYACDLCPKTFSQRSTLKVHRRYHTGERPFPCPDCPKAFITQTALGSHKTTHQSFTSAQNQ